MFIDGSASSAACANGSPTHSEVLHASQLMRHPQTYEAAETLHARSGAKG
jgi:hypothetical protein